MGLPASKPRVEPAGWVRRTSPAGSLTALDSTRAAALSIFPSMLRISPRSIINARPPTGAAVRLRNNPDVTGVVLGDAFEPGRLRVRWDDNDEITDCISAKLEPVR